MTKLKAVKDLKIGDVIYLRPDHARYSPEWFAICVRAPGSLTCVSAVAPDPYDPGARTQIAFPDTFRAVEIVAERRMADCCGLTHRQMRVARQRAREGLITSADLFAPIPSQSRKPAEIAMTGERGTDLVVDERDQIVSVSAESDPLP